MSYSVSSANAGSATPSMGSNALAHSFPSIAKLIEGFSVRNKTTGASLCQPIKMPTPPQSPLSFGVTFAETAYSVTSDVSAAVSGISEAKKIPLAAVLTVPSLLTNVTAPPTLPALMPQSSGNGRFVLPST